MNLNLIPMGLSAYNGTDPHVRIPGRGPFKICSRAFFENKTLETLEIPEGVYEIDREAFMNCENLREIILPSTLNPIYSRAFAGCVNLRSIRFPNGVHPYLYTSPDVFEGCRSLGDENGMIIIGGILRAYCGEGGSVTVTDGVRSIRPDVFSRMESITEIRLPEGLEYIGESAFFSCALKQIDLPEGLEYIGENAFSGSIREVSLPKSLNHLGNQAFRRCPVRKLTIPEGLFRDYGVVPGENSRWIDNFIDINPFNYEDGQLLCANVICRNYKLDSKTLKHWADILKYVNPMFQVLSGEGEPLSVWELNCREERDYLVTILNLDRIVALIREDDVSVMDYLDNQGPINLYELLDIAEEAQAPKVCALLQEMLDCR